MAEIAAYPLEAKANSKMSGPLWKYTALLNDTCKWTSALILSKSDIQVYSFFSVFFFLISSQDRARVIEVFYFIV
jgi:hypothetical protein